VIDARAARPAPFEARREAGFVFLMSNGWTNAAEGKTP
jgi:hypothetical protein